MRILTVSLVMAMFVLTCGAGESRVSSPVAISKIIDVKGKAKCVYF